MAEYIEREALIENFKSCGASKELTEAIIYRINSRPTADVVEVVRCKDCRHLSDSGGSYWCKETGFEMKSYELEHFCSYGERKE